jgi:hypothetical protein
MNGVAELTGLKVRDLLNCSKKFRVISIREGGLSPLLVLTYSRNFMTEHLSE